MHAGETVAGKQRHRLARREHPQHRRLVPRLRSVQAAAQRQLLFEATVQLRQPRRPGERLEQAGLAHHLAQQPEPPTLGLGFRVRNEPQIDVQRVRAHFVLSRHRPDLLQGSLQDPLGQLVMLLPHRSAHRNRGSHTCQAPVARGFKMAVLVADCWELMISVSPCLRVSVPPW